MAATYVTPGVYVEEVKSKSSTLSPGATAVAAFVGFTEKAPTDDPDDPFGERPRMVTNWTQFTDLYGGFTSTAMLPHSVYGYFLNGGSVAYIVRIPHTEPAKESGRLELPSGDRALGPAVAFTTAEPNAKISISILAESDSEAKPESSAKPKAATKPESGDADGLPSYTVEVIERAASGKKSDEKREKYEHVTVATISDALKGSTRVKVETKLDLGQLPPMLQTLPTGEFAIQPAPGQVVKVPAQKFSGKESTRTGISGLTIADNVTMVIVPDLVNAARKDDGTTDLGLWKSVQLALINHCELQANRMALLDAPPDLSPQQVKEWRTNAMYDSKFAALYYPWISVANPAATNGDTEIKVPPSGHMAGIWARTDDTRGVWKAPANEIVRGALSVATNITKGEQGELNPIGINCIRPFGVQGIRIWGARTLSTTETDWTYINVRRLFNMIESTIMTGTQYAVFEPNDQALWEGLTRTVSSFLRGLWRDGALFGASEEQAFYVKCDAETNPQDSIDLGKVVVEVGIAPVKPAEFVVFRIAQIKGES